MWPAPLKICGPTHGVSFWRQSTPALFTSYWEQMGCRQKKCPLWTSRSRAGLDTTFGAASMTSPNWTGSTTWILPTVICYNRTPRLIEHELIQDGIVIVQHQSTSAQNDASDAFSNSRQLAD